jgi:hypothetical protein
VLPPLLRPRRWFRASNTLWTAFIATCALSSIFYIAHPALAFVLMVGILSFFGTTMWSSGCDAGRASREIQLREVAQAVAALRRDAGEFDLDFDLRQLRTTEHLLGQ